MITMAGTGRLKDAFRWDDRLNRLDTCTGLKMPEIGPNLEVHGTHLLRWF